MTLQGHSGPVRTASFSPDGTRIVTASDDSTAQLWHAASGSGLGDTGRYRTNVWEYAGVNSLGACRDEELAMHPTLKPVGLVADAIKDCSKRGEIVLDPFAGSGTTLIAAEKTGRCARVIEFDATYCDRIIQRFERLTGKTANIAMNGRSFEEMADEGLVSSSNADLEEAA